MGNPRSAKKKRKPAQASSMADAAYARLRQLILSCDLQPGAWVTVAELSKRIGFGRAPLYEALVRLESERFVSPLKRRGWQVAPLTLERVTQIFEAWGAMSRFLTRLAIERESDDKIRSLHELSRHYGWPGAGKDQDVRETFDSAPFDTMAHFGDNPLVADMAADLLAHFERVFNFALLQGTFADARYVAALDAIEDAMISRDLEAAYRANDQMLEVTAEEIFRLLGGTASVMSTPLVLAATTDHRSSGG